MSTWWERSRKRDLELAEGADADLMQANRRRYRVAFALMGLAVLIVYLEPKIHLPGKLSTIIRVLAAASFEVGVLLVKWAQTRVFVPHPP